MIREPHCLVVNPAVHISLLAQIVNDVVVTPAWPMVGGKEHLGLVTKEADRLVDVFRPRECVTHQGTPDGHEVMHRVSAVFCHTQPTEIWKEEIHFGWGLSFGGQLKHNPYPIDVELLAGEGDLLGWRNETRSGNRKPLSEAAIDVSRRPWWQQRSELIRSAPAHRKTSNHIFCDRFVEKSLRSNDSASSGVNFFLAGDAKHATKVVGVRVGVDHRDNRAFAEVRVR